MLEQITSFWMVEEGEQAQIQFDLDAPSGLDVTVDWATSDGSAVAPADYTAASGTVTIGAGETSAVALVVSRFDEISESDETFLVTLSNQARVDNLGVFSGAKWAVHGLTSLF